MTSSMVARAPPTSMSATAANTRPAAAVLFPQQSDLRLLPKESEGPRRPLARRAADAAELPRLLRLLLPTVILIKEKEK